MLARDKMKYIEFKSHLLGAIGGEQKLSSVYVVGGDDEYLRSSVTKAFKGVLAESFFEFNFTSTQNVDEALDALYTFPMFDDKRVVVLIAEEVPSEDELAKLNEYFANPIDTAILVVSASKDALKELKSKKANFVDCSTLDEPSLAEEIHAICDAPPKRTITSGAIRELAQRTQNNMTRIASELAKLKCYVDSEISLEDVKQMVVADLEFQTYELSSAVSDKNADKALEIITTFLQEGMNGNKIVVLLYDRYRKMLHAELNKAKTNDELGELLGMKSGAVYYLKKTSQNYSQVRLKKCVDYLHKLQVDILTSKQKQDNVLHMAILQLLAI